jgi:hypothetical protein
MRSMRWMQKGRHVRVWAAAALEHAGSFTLQENGRWGAYGEDLTVIVQVDAPAVVVWTVFAG